MYKQIDSIEHVNGNNIIWRYMGIEKFLHLITSNQLFLCRLSKMTDKYEGTLPRQNFRSRLSQLAKENRVSALEIAEQERKEIESHKDQVFINCWTQNPDELHALWKIYLSGSNCGVAIKSTVGRLRNAIETKSPKFDFFVGKVNYTDFIKDYPPNPIELTITKNVYYDYEKELRLFTYSTFSNLSKEVEAALNGISFNIDTDILIDRIYLSPFIGSWFYDSFKKTLEKMNPKLASRIEFSAIRDV